jgi:hypothetical protein
MSSGVLTERLKQCDNLPQVLPVARSGTLDMFDGQKSPCKGSHAPSVSSEKSVTEKSVTEKSVSEC